jgi:host factor-I protein
MVTKAEVNRLFNRGVDELFLFINELEKKYQQEKPKSHAVAIAAPTAKEVDVTLPSTRNLHSMIRSQTQVEIKLRTGETMQGRIGWIDPDCLCLEGSHTIIIWQRAIAFIQPT